MESTLSIPSDISYRHLFILQNLWLGKVHDVRDASMTLDKLGSSSSQNISTCTPQNSKEVEVEHNRKRVMNSINLLEYNIVGLGVGEPN